MKMPTLLDLPALPAIPGDIKTMSVTQRHVLIVTHAVPAERVRPQLPAQFALDTLKVQGQACALLQMVCCLNENFHYTPLAKPSLDFWQATYRVLTRQPLREETTTASGARFSRADPGTFVFKNYIGTKAAWVVGRAVASEAQNAAFNIVLRGDYANGEYAGYVADITPGETRNAEGQNVAGPPTQVAARMVRGRAPLAPFASWEKMVDFLTHRPNGYCRVSVGGGIVVLPVEQPVMDPRAAELVTVAAEIPEARFGVWEQMGLLGPREMREPYSVLIQPAIACVLQAPHGMKKS